MKLAGKCPPEPDKLKIVSDSGFERTELYTTKDHLDTLDKTIQICKNADIEISSVHTPHVTEGDKEYLRKAITLADAFNARIVVDANPIPLDQLVELEENNTLEYGSLDHGYENRTIHIKEDMIETVLETGHDMTLDTAHLYRNNPDTFKEEFTTLLDNYDEQISIVHLCDATPEEDHVQFTEGSMPLGFILQQYKQSDVDYIVLELMPEEQGQALDTITQIVDSL